MMDKLCLEYSQLLELEYGKEVSKDFITTIEALDGQQSVHDQALETMRLNLNINNMFDSRASVMKPNFSTRTKLGQVSKRTLRKEEIHQMFI